MKAKQKKPSICMRLSCEECGVRFDIPEDKMDDFNIYFRGTADGVELTPRLLCPICTDKFVAKLDRG